MAATRGTGKDRISSRYSRGVLRFRPEAMDNDRVPPQKKNGGSRILSNHKDNERDPSLNKEGEERIPPNKDQVDNRRLPTAPYAEVGTFEETDSVTLFTKDNYKVAISFGLASAIMRLINRFFDTGAGPNLLQEYLVEPERLPSIHLCDSRRLKSATGE